MVKEPWKTIIVADARMSLVLPTSLGIGNVARPSTTGSGLL